MNLYKYLLSAALSALCFAGLSSCGADDTQIDESREVNEVRFCGGVMKIAATRTDTKEPEYDLISSENEYGEVHIHAFADNADDTFLKYGVYVTRKGGTAGILDAKDAVDGKLEWFNTSADHYFHAWTVPDGVSMSGNKMESGRVDFKPTDDDKLPNTGINSRNNHALEKFIGSVKGPVSYRTNNSYVELIFRHLVSKITITGVQRTKLDNTKVWLGDVVIYFPDMPRYADFKTGVNKDNHLDVPVVTADANSVRGLSFNAVSPVEDETSTYYPFYLPPFKFSDYGEFIVTGISWGEDGREDCGPYYGNLSDLDFDGLNGGEHLGLTLHVKDGQVFGFATTILGWDEMPERNSGHSPKHKGIYNYDDLRRLCDYLNSPSDNDNKLDGLYTIEKNEKGDEIKVIRIFSDIDLTEYGMDVNHWLNVPSDVVIDGMGHNIIFSQDKGSIFKYGSENVKNLYQNGELYQ